MVPRNQYTIPFQNLDPLLTGAMGTVGRSPLPWRSGDSELLPLGESSPEGGDKLRSTRGAAVKRPSTFSGNLGFSRKPKRQAQFGGAGAIGPREPGPPISESLTVTLEADGSQAMFPDLPGAPGF